jgi:hypothetical protein
MSQIPSPKEWIVSDDSDSDELLSQVLLQTQHLHGKEKSVLLELKEEIESGFSNDIIGKSREQESNTIRSIQKSFLLGQTPPIPRPAKFLERRSSFNQWTADHFPSTPVIIKSQKQVTKDMLMDFEKTPTMEQVDSTEVPTSPITNLDYEISQELDALTIPILKGSDSFETGTTASLDDLSISPAKLNLKMNQETPKGADSSLHKEEWSKADSQNTPKRADFEERSRNPPFSPMMLTPTIDRISDGVTVHKESNPAIAEYDTGISTQMLLEIDLEEEEYNDPQINTQFMAQIPFSQFDDAAKGTIATEFHTAKTLMTNGTVGVVVDKSLYQKGEMFALEQDEEGPIKYGFRGTTGLRETIRSQVQKSKVLELFRPTILHETSVLKATEKVDNDERERQDVTHQFESFFDHREHVASESMFLEEKNSMNVADESVCFGGFRTAGGKPLSSPSLASKARAAAFLEMETPKASGFTNAAGKPLPPVSEEAKERASLLLAQSSDGPLGEYSRASGNRLPSPSGIVMEEDARIMEFGTPKASGFLNAAGKPLPPVSKEAKDMALHVLKVRPEQNKIPIEGDPIAFGGFKTGVGEKLPQPSELAIKKFDSMLFDTKETCSPTVAVPNSLFTTASGTKLKAPSRFAQLQAEQLLLSTPIRTSGSTESNVDEKSIKKSFYRTPSLSRNYPTKMSLSTGKLPGKGTISISGIKNTPFKPPFRALQKPFRNDSPSPSTLKPTPDRRVFFDTSGLQDRPTLRERFDSFAIDQMQEGAWTTITAQNATEVEFSGWDWKTARQELIQRGCAPQLASEVWVKNHYRWIVWKLASLKRVFAVNVWTKDHVFSQLLYRYEVEINQANRSCIRLLVERDAVVGRHMVLCISRVDFQSKAYSHR